MPIIFHEGDTVRLLHGWESGVDDNARSHLNIGDYGIVCEDFSSADTGRSTVAVNFGSNIEGHDCNGHCPEGYGQCIFSECLQLITPAIRNSKFKIGDRVELLPSYVHAGNYTPSFIVGSRAGMQGIVRKMDGDQIGIEFPTDVGGHDLSGLCPPRHGQNIKAVYLKLISKSSSDTTTRVLRKRKGKIMKKNIGLTLTRESGATWLTFKVDPEITKMFKEQSEDVRESKNWTGLKFYYVPNIISAPDYVNMLRTYDLIDDFGQNIFQEGRLNIAWMRTVDGEGKIKITEPVTIAKMSGLVENATTFIRKYFEEYFRDAKITGNITVDLP